MIDFVLTVLSTTAVSAALLAAAGWLFRSWITERLKNAIKHEYDRELESYKSVLSLVHAATAEGQKAAMEARIQAFDRIWKAVLALRDNTGFITQFLDILTIQEYKDIKHHPQFVQLVGGLDETRISKMLPDAGVEQARPYVGAIVWSLFYAYQALNLRIVLLAWLASTKDEDKIHWYRDPVMRNLLQTVLSKEEMATFEATQIGRIALFRRLIEAKLLFHWQRLISGAEFGDEALKQADAILEATSRLGRKG